MEQTDTKLQLLDPTNCAVLLIDHQPQMAFAIDHIDRQLLVNNVVGLAKAAQVFKVPIVLSAVESQSFSGYNWSPLMNLFPGVKPIERSSINAWEDKAFVKAVKATGRKKLVIAGLWTEACVAFPALSAMAEGYEVYVAADCSAGASKLTHDMAIQRLIQAGAVPITWMHFMYELQRDWARRETYDAVVAVVLAHGGAHGLGVEYAKSMVHEQKPAFAL